jgi:hypothetical protein
MLKITERILIEKSKIDCYSLMFSCCHFVCPLCVQSSNRKEREVFSYSRNFASSAYFQTGVAVKKLCDICVKKTVNLVAAAILHIINGLKLRRIKISQFFFASAVKKPVKTARCFFSNLRVSDSPAYSDMLKNGFLAFKYTIHLYKINKLIYILHTF